MTSAPEGLERAIRGLAAIRYRSGASATDCDLQKLGSLSTALRIEHLVHPAKKYSGLICERREIFMDFDIRPQQGGQ
jgi:hypothetical protein